MFKKKRLKYFLNFLLLIISINFYFFPHFSSCKNKEKKQSYPFPYFTEVSQQAGVDIDLKSVFCTWVDFDKDGWLDLFVSNGYNQRNFLFHNVSDGTFEDITESAGLLSFLWSDKAQWMDYDNDGFLDFYLQNKLRNQFFKNSGQNQFIDIAETFNFPLGPTVWADFNNDGWLDVFVYQADENREKAGSPQNFLYKNLKNGRFEEISDAANLTDKADTFSANWIDYNNDSLLDLFVANGNGQPDFLYKNNGNGTFTDVFSSTGIKNCDGAAFWVDFNNDGWIDLFRQDRDNSVLYINEGNNSFREISSSSGIKIPDYVFSANFIDIDNDGYLDIHFQAEIVNDHYSKAFIYKNNGDETFSQILSDKIQAVNDNNYSSSWGDYDNDGDPDLYLANKNRNLLFRNEGIGNNWIKINLISRQSNRDAFGAQIKVVSGALRQYKQVGVGQESKSENRQTLLFGMAQHTLVDSIVVRWPSGMRQDTFNIAVNQIIDIQEPPFSLFTNATRISGLSEYVGKSFGCTFVDFDRDNQTDIFICNHEDKNLFFKNIGFGTFRELSDTIGFNFNTHLSALGFGDFDNDGFGDLYLANAVFAPNIFLTNTGGGILLNISKTTGTAGAPVFSTDLVLLDFDNNGLLDIYVANDGPNVLFMNKGNFKFTDVSRQAGVDDSLISFCTAADYDNDGDMDIFVANSRGGYDDYPIKKGWPNRLFRNNGNGTFTDVAREAGVLEMSNSKGCCFGDYDNDGNLDLYVGNDGSSNSLFHNNGDGTFTNMASQAGVGEPIGTHGVVFADFNNDGYLDIYAGGGSYIPEQHDYCMNKDHPDKLYLNNSDGTFTDITKQAGIDFNKAMTIGLATADIDNDGDLDVMVLNSFYKGIIRVKNILLRNNTSKNHWIHFKLTGRKSNKFAIGARVELISGDLIQIREVSGGIGLGSQSSLPVEFGIGSRESIKQVNIRWPSGVIQKIKNPAINQMHFIEEPYQIGPLQFSAIGYRRLKFSFFSLLGAIFLYSVVFLIIIPTIKNIVISRKTKREEAARRIELTLSQKPKPESEDDDLLFSKRVVAPIKPTLFVKISTIKFRGEHLLTYLVEPFLCTPELEKLFEERIENKTPYAISEIKIQRLLQKIDYLWQQYTKYLGSHVEEKPSPLMLLQEIGEVIYNYFGMTALLNKIFSLSQVEDLHISFILDNMLIPWHWAFHPYQKKFLCEKFPYGVSFAKEKIDSSSRKRGSKNTEKTSSVSNALILYGDWKGHSKELTQVSKEIREIELLLKKNHIKVHRIYQDADKFASTISDLQNEGKNISLIHYSGHIEDNMLALGENEFLPVSFLQQTYGLEFLSQPVVFLNGCRSGEITTMRQRHYNLTTEFLDCGASACVVTCFQIPEISAKNFAFRFYHYFITEKMTVAEAMQKARLEIADSAIATNLNPEYDITRYFYNLYGEATSSFF